jgi:hypothetical protein
MADNYQEFDKMTYRCGRKKDAMWPTPTSNEDACGQPTGKMQAMLGNHPDVRGDGGGSLNPNWVEWLMGYPVGWTDCEVSATP